MTGVRFEKLLVIRRDGNSADGTACWLCLCDCGQERVIAGTRLRAGRNKSCGCSSPRFDSLRTKTHGMSGTRTYKIWIGMRFRCSDNATGKSRRNYYDKGIRVCDRWGDFKCFLADMGEAPAGCSIDRIDGSKGYSKENCRWATPKQQANNTSRNSIVSFNDLTQTVGQWAEYLGVKPNTLLYRLRRGIPLYRAMSAEIGSAGSDRVALRKRACAVCGREFIPRSTQIRSGGGLYCSQACNGRAHSRK